MIIKIGKYEPFGKQILDKRPHLKRASNKTFAIDFSNLNIEHQDLGTTSFYKLFNVSDSLEINVGDKSDERNPLQFGKIENPDIELEQEIYVEGSVVVWTRAGYVKKTFDYSEEVQPIQKVLFAWFPVTSTFFKSDPTNKPVVDIDLSDLGDDKHLVEDYWDKRGPQSIINFNRAREEEEEDLFQKKDLFHSAEEENNQLQRRALCIVFQDCIKIHYEDGLSATAHIPFQIGDVIPLDQGVIVSRKHLVGNRKGKGKGRSGSVTSLASMAAGHPKLKDESEITSHFVTVTHPIKGACPVRSKESNSSSILNLQEPLTNPQKLLFATTKSDDTGRLPVIVTLNLRENKHYIWTYERRKDINEFNLPLKLSDGSYPQYSIPTKRKSNATPINKRKYLKTSATNAPSTPNRNKKYKSNVVNSYPQFHEDYLSDDEILYENELEKIVYHEMLDQSEISVKLLWKETHTLRMSTKLKSTKDVRSEAFLTHNLDGEEMICIMNYTLGTLQVINLLKAFKGEKEGIKLDINARFAVPINATRDNFIDLLYVDHVGFLQLFIHHSMPKLPIILDSENKRTITKLLDPVYDRFTVKYDTGEHVRYQLNLRPKMSLVRDCFAAIDCATTEYFEKIWYRYIKNLCFDPKPKKMDGSTVEWEAFFITLLSFIKIKKRSGRNYYHPSVTKRNSTSKHNTHQIKLLTPKEIQLEQNKKSNSKFIKNELGFKSSSSLYSYEFILDKNYTEGVPARWIEHILTATRDVTIDLDMFSDIVSSLHVIYEDYRIKKSMAIHANLLGYFLMQSAIILGNNDWIEYYESHGIDSTLAGNLQSVEENMGRLLIEPPNIQVCLRQMTPNTLSKLTLFSSFGVNTLEPTLGHYLHSYAKTINQLWSLYGAINHASKDKSVLLERMVANNISRKDIEILMDSVASPILEILDELKLYPDVKWTAEAYNIIGREDIYKQLQMNITVCDPNTDTFKLPFLKDSDFPQNVSDLMKDYTTTHVNKCIYETDILNMETERLRFGFGGVIEKVRMMLDATRVPEHVVPEVVGRTDDDVAADHQNQLLLLLQRTLSSALGRAIYAYGTHVPDLTKVLPIEPINTSAKILPLRTIVNVDESILSNEFMNWPNFHNGVAAGLRISPSNHVNDSWIDFCNPPELEPHHGGVLLAMGLHGLVKKLPLVYYYRFMTQSCELVLIGFIMAATVAYRGTRDKKITKVLAVYIPALLPPESDSFEHSNVIEAAGLLGMGLNFMNSCDRLMGSIMLKEISKYAYSDPSTLAPDYEGCALAAGFALGFITLGVGNAALDLIDKELHNKLYNLMVGRSTLAKTRREKVKEKKESRSINLDVTSPGATIALGLMYLKTENAKVADSIELLETMPYLNYVRPDLLLLRVVAKNLIMWGTIQASDDWIDSQLPDFITSNSENNLPNLEDSSSDESFQLIDDEVIKQAMYNIICGACLSMGLRFAGSRNEDAFRVLLNRLDFFVRLLQVQETSPQQQVTKCAVGTCVDVICTAAAMVMAGTGNRELVSRLEQLNQRISEDMTYGNHMAVSMSLGLLFMGLGGYTLTTTNESIAGLLCAFYPFYPITTEDNRYHLQAFRHLWVLAVDSRWLMSFDVANKKPCRVPMCLELYEDDGSKAPPSLKKVRQVRIEAPTVVPDYKLIKSIQLDGDRYWPLSVNMTENGKYQNSIIKSGVIYVKRKEKKRSYETDPSGRRNITWT